MRRAPERWLLSHDGRHHVVEIVDAGLRRRVSWVVDGTVAASRTTDDERVVLDGGEVGALGVRLPALVGPARRVTFHPPGGDPSSGPGGLGGLAAAHAGVGGIDLDPEAGSAAAEREAWIRAHPRRYAARRTLAAAAAVLVPLLAFGLLPRLDIPWPDLPDIPWPDLPNLPDLPWPDLPAIPWPGLPDWSLPAWVRAVLDKARYVVPVVVALVLARGEIRRRRAQDARKAAASATPRPVEGPGAQPTGTSRIASGPAPGVLTQRTAAVDDDPASSV